jgi:hypothetical protein
MLHISLSLSHTDIPINIPFNPHFLNDLVHHLWTDQGEKLTPPLRTLQAELSPKSPGIGPIRSHAWSGASIVSRFRRREGDARGAHGTHVLSTREVMFF